MPIYGYRCTNCEHTLDALQKMSDDPLVDCPACNEPTLKRQLSAPRFRLKGQGWYETDFKQDNQRNLAGDKQDQPDKPEKADKKPDKKPDKKADDAAPATKTEEKAANKLDRNTADKSDVA